MWVAAMAAGCRCDGRLTSDEAARTCFVLQVCLPREWQQQCFGYNLATCSTGALLPPSPGALADTPAVKTGLEQPLLDIYRCVLGSGSDCSKVAGCFARAAMGGTCAP